MMDAMDIQAVESKLNDVTVTAIPMNSHANSGSSSSGAAQSQPYNFSTSGGNSSSGRYQSQQSTPSSSGRGGQLHNKPHLHIQQQMHHYSQPQPAHQSYKPPHGSHLHQSSSSTSASVASPAAPSTGGQFHAHGMSSPSSPHISMVPVSQLSPLVGEVLAANSFSRSQQRNATNQNHNSSQYTAPPMAPTTPPMTLSETSASMLAQLGSPSGVLSAAVGTLGPLPPAGTATGVSKYAMLLAIIEEMGRDIRPTYTGSRSSAERLKRGIVHARLLVRECLVETERSARQN